VCRPLIRRGLCDVPIRLLSSPCSRGGIISISGPGVPEFPLGARPVLPVHPRMQPFPSQLEKHSCPKSRKIPSPPTIRKPCPVRRRFPMRAGPAASANPESSIAGTKSALHRLAQASSGYQNSCCITARPTPTANQPYRARGLTSILKDGGLKKKKKKAIIFLAFRFQRLPGWDCHGLRYEWRSRENYRSKGKRSRTSGTHRYGSVFRTEFLSYATHWLNLQPRNSSGSASSATGIILRTMDVRRRSADRARADDQFAANARSIAAHSLCMCIGGGKDGARRGRSVGIQDYTRIWSG